MERVFRKKKVLPLCMAVVLMVASANISAAASPLGQNNIPIGSNGYISLHNYVSPTSSADIFKVTMEVYSPGVGTNPLYISIVMDETASMYHQASKDAPYTLPGGGTNYYSRWQVQKKQYIDLINALADPIKNPSYEQTYVAVFGNSNAQKSRIRTADESSGQSDPALSDFENGYFGYATLKQSTPNTIDTTTHVATFTSSELYFKNSDLDAYQGIRYGIPTTSGFVKVADSKDKLLKLLPDYPYMSTPLAESLSGYSSVAGVYQRYGAIVPPSPPFTQGDSYGMGWPYAMFNLSGSGATKSFVDTRYLMEMTWDKSNPDAVAQPENARRITILFSDNLEDDMGPKIGNTDELQRAAAILKAPRTYFDQGSGSMTPGLQGVASEVWIVGVGFGFYEPSSYPALGRDDFSNYRLFEGADSDFTLSYGYLEHKANWAAHFPNWAANSPLVDDLGTGEFPDYMNFNVTGTVLFPTGSTSTYSAYDCDPIWAYCSQYMEPHLVALAMPSQDESDYENFFPANSQENIDYQDIFKFYATHGTKDANGNAIANYEYVESINDSVDMFQSFGEFYTDDPAYVSIDLASEFELVRFENSSMFTITGGTNAGSATSSGSNQITWNIATMPIQEASYTLTFYVKANRSLMKDDLSYNVFSSTPYLSYGRFGQPSLGENSISRLTVVKYFPTVYVSGGGNSIAAVKNEDSSTSGFTKSENAGSGTSSNSGLSVLPGINTSSNTAYTPSVTPSSNNIEGEKLQEKTNEEVVKTGVFTVAIPVLLLVLIISAAAIYYKTKKESQR